MNQLVDEYAIKTKIKLIGYSTYLNKSKLIQMVMQEKHVLVGPNQDLDSITKFMNQRFFIPFHLSKQKLFLSFVGFAMRKSLLEQITNKINRM